MAGYTPVFDSIFTGTLCGKYPDTAAWLFLLALADKHGVIDMTPQYISNVTGMPVPDLVGCIQRFMEPDPHSRTTECEGRRLVPIAADRDWGWRIVNHGLYRERARLMAKNEREVQSGANAQRLKETAADRRSPPNTAADRLSDADANTRKTAPQRSRGCRVPEPFPITEDMRTWASVKCPHVANVDGATEEFVDYWRGVSGRAALKVDWLGTWRNRMRELEARASRGNGRARVSSEWT